MKVTVDFIRCGRVCHTRTFDIEDIDSFIDRLNERFNDYELFVSELDLTGEETTRYDKNEHGDWYTYTGRMVYSRSPYGGRWWYEYINNDEETALY